MYFSINTQTGRKINELSQRELLDYACDSFYYDLKYILRDKEIFALPEFLEQYEYISNAIDKRIQQHVDHDYFDYDYYYWCSYRNGLNILKNVFVSYASKVLKSYDDYIQSLPNKEQFLQPVEGKKQIKWFEGEIDKAQQFYKFACKAFPFLKPNQIQRWESENEYYRTVFYKQFFDYNRWWERYDSLHQINELYTLYHKEAISNKVEYTIYSLPSEESYDKLLGLEPCDKHPFSMQKVIVSEDSANYNIDSDSFYCITADFVMTSNGKWPTLQTFIEYTAKSLLSQGDSAEVRMIENAGIYYSENKFFNNIGNIYIENNILPFEADWHHGYSINEKEYKHLKVYILSPKCYQLGRNVEYVSEAIELYQPARILSVVYSDFANIRVSRKGDVTNPNKAIMMLTLHQAIQEGWITTNKICITDQLESLFNKNWKRYASSCACYKPLFADTLYRLKTEPFCMLVRHDGEVDKAKLQPKQILRSDFENGYRYIEIEDFHFAALRNKKITEVIDDIFYRLFENNNVKYYLSLDEILRKGGKQSKNNNSPKRESIKDNIIPPNAYPIPSGMKDLPSCSYRGRLDITDLVIPEGVKSIGNLAFEGCINIQSITFPDSLISIGNAAFKKCYNLQSVSFGAKLNSIGKSAFARCERLENVTLSQSLKEIGPRAFFHCSSLKSIIIPSKVEGTGEAAFAHCTSLTDLTITKGVEQIDYASFLGCTSLTHVIIPASVHWVGDSPFADTSLQRLSFAEGNVTCYLNPYKGIPTLKIIDIPSCCNFISTPFVLYSVMPSEINIAIGNKTYKYKDGVLYKRYKELVYCRKDKETLDVPAGIQTIGTYALAGCELLRELRLPDSLKKIEDKALLKCKKLSIVYVPNETIYRLVEKEINLKCQIIIENQ